MSDAPLHLFLPSDADTARLGQWFAPRLRAGDVVALAGPIGAGKTHFARALIQTRLGHAEDVPSPSFTLVQSYQAPDVELWHADLYRLTHPDEVLELGLDEAFETAICLVEWPERMGAALPARALHLRLDSLGEGRQADITLGGRPDLAPALRQDWGVE